MYRINLFLLALCSASQAVYINRMSTINRVRAPPPFRPGVMLRPMYQQRLMATPSHRPYIMYRNNPQRYAIKKFNASPIQFNNRNVFWKSTTPRLPLPSTPVVKPTPEFDFVRSASSPPIVSADGAIHTIPAPNLSLSEKPIVVIDNDNIAGNTAYTSKPTYEVTERHPEQSYQSGKISQPASFSKPQEFAPIDYQNIRNNAALQFASEYALPAIQMSQQTFTPQQYSMHGLFHGINGLPTQFPENILHHREPEGIVIPPNPIFQSDPSFLQKLQAQLMQQYPTLEFIPYAPDVQPQSIPQPSEPEPQIYLFKNEQQIVKQEPSAFVPSENKNVVQRETEEKSIIPLLPQAFSLNNATEISKIIDTTTVAQPVNVTAELVSETQAPTTTFKYIIETNDNEKTTPIYYAQVGQSIDNVIANNIFSALPVIREHHPQTESPVTVTQPTPTTTTTEASTTTVTTTTQFEPKTTTTEKILNKEPKLSNINLNLIGSPFEKTAESVNVAYTILRTNDNQSKLNKDGSVFAGQLVEAKVSEDQDFNKEKATFAKRAPLRLFAVTEKLNTEPPKVNVVKAKSPPKSKLTFDDKTGEPVLRIYASYMDNPSQKEQLTTRLSNMKTTTMMTKKQDSVESWKGATGHKEKLASLASNPDRESQFGLKLKSRSDDYNIPLFDDYE